MIIHIKMADQFSAKDVKETLERTANYVVQRVDRAADGFWHVVTQVPDTTPLREFGSSVRNKFGEFFRGILVQ